MTKTVQNMLLVAKCTSFAGHHHTLQADLPVRGTWWVPAGALFLPTRQLAGVRVADAAWEKPGRGGSEPITTVQITTLISHLQMTDSYMMMIVYLVN